MFLALVILYPNDRLVMATKTCRAAKLYQRPLNSMRSLSVLNWTSESEYFGRYKIGSKKKCRLIIQRYSNKNCDENRTCAFFHSHFEWEIMRMRRFSSLFWCKDPENRCI